MITNHKIILLLITLITGYCAYADTITVKQDGSGDYAIIQEAVNASADGDTIIVWPGTYYENIDFAGHSITLASLVLTTGDLSYKYSTIIDGNENGSCVKIMEGEIASVIGFTMQHGTGSLIGTYYYGGGICVMESSCNIINCVIHNNVVIGGGGGIASFFNCSVFLSGNSIYENQAYGGGGVFIGDDCNANFDSIYLCSIYSNFSQLGCDLHKAYYEFPLTLYLDTCTVLNPDWYFVSSIEDHGYQIDDIDINVQNGLLTPIDADLYVNPISGNNNNSGLSPGEALQSIAFAYSLIYPDSTNKNTIHLANGVYSDSTNNEKFPLNIRGYINVTGESMKNTILDGRYRSGLMKGNNEVSNYSFSKMTMQRGGNVEFDWFGLLWLYIGNDNAVFDSIIFKEGEQADSHSAFELTASKKTIVKNCMFTGNNTGKTLQTSSLEGDTLIIENCKFYDNTSTGFALKLHGGHNTHVAVVNSLFTNNYNNAGAWATSTDLTANFVNCTFTDNTALANQSSLQFVDANANLYNCIVFNEISSKPIKQYWHFYEDTVSINIKHSLIENGEDDIYVEWPFCTYNYDDSNIEGDPLFYYGPDFPYNLSDNSPCIDAGTLDIPDWIELPEYDLAGNPRIFGSTIDMGCYEWNPTVGVPENTVKPKEKLLSLAPNPAVTSTLISAQSSGANTLKIEVYNNSGQRVAVIVDTHVEKGIYTTTWNLTSNNTRLIPGIYYIILLEDGIEKDGVKMVVM